MGCLCSWCSSCWCCHKDVCSYCCCCCCCRCLCARRARIQAAAVCRSLIICCDVVFAFRKAYLSRLVRFELILLRGGSISLRQEVIVSTPCKSTLFVFYLCGTRGETIRKAKFTSSFSDYAMHVAKRPETKVNHTIYVWNVWNAWQEGLTIKFLVSSLDQDTLKIGTSLLLK